MRKLPLLLLPLSLLLVAAASAHALSLPAAPPQATAFVAPEDDEETEADDEGEAGGDESEADDGEGCSAEEDDLCEEGDETEAAEECLLEDARASFTAAPGAGEVRLRVHYRAFEPTAVVIDASLRGAKGNLHLGSRRAHFHRAGVYRYSFDLGSKKMAKAVAARELDLSLRAVGAPAECELELATRGSRRAR